MRGELAAEGAATITAEGTDPPREPAKTTDKAPRKSAEQGATELPEMTVTAPAYDPSSPYNTDYNRPNASTATKTDTPIMETPVSIQVIPQQVLKDQQAIRLDRALENVSGVYRDQGFNLTDTFSVRGFRTFTHYRDGIPLEAALTQAGTRELANIERVEVLKGPASILYGRINPGGLVNLVTKQPLVQPHYSLQQQFGSFDHYRTAIDATGPITADDTLLYRFNLAYENYDSFREFVEGERVFLAPVLRWNIGSNTQATFELEYKHNEAFLDVGFPAIGDRPADLPRERFLGESFDRGESDEVIAGFHWSHDFNDHWSLSHRFNALLTEEEDALSFPFGLDEDGRTLSRGLFGFRDNEVETYFTTLNLTGHINTWGVAHTLLVGADYYDFTNTGVFLSGPLDPIDIFDPVHTMGPAVFDGESPYETDKERYGIYIQDQIKLPFNVHLLAGGRYDWTNAANIRAEEQEANAFTPRVGLLWQTMPQLSLYGSYVENFGSDDFFLVNPDGSTLEPDTAQQWEAGLKTELFGGRLQGTLAFYELTKQNIPTPDPIRPFFSRAVGEARNRGIELDVAGEILPGWRVMSAYSYIDSEITKDVGVDESGNPTTENEGNRLANVPRHGGSLWTTYEFLEGDLLGLKLGAGVVPRSQREGDNANTFQLPGHALVHLLASYSWKLGASRITAQLNVDNLLDKEYFPNALDSRNRIDVGAPRTFLGSIRLEF